MPKERRDRAVSYDRCRASPFPCSSSRATRPSSKYSSEKDENMKEWEEARCPVCMEHPHNAVLLICTSHEKGCRPYMCDTSYRHSNCLDQFRKSFVETLTPPRMEETLLSTTNSSLAVANDMSATPQLEETQLSITESYSVVATEPTSAESRDERSEDIELTMSCEHKVQPKLVCPLCRGQVIEWIVEEPARRFMNAKSRSCACETCNFSGAYTDLRKHARVEHPLVRPSEADPERQRHWRRLERQRDLGDLLSTLQSSFGEEMGEEGILPIGDDGGWLTVLLLIRVFRPGTLPRNSSRSGTSRTRAQLSLRRRSTRLWGESYDAETRSSSRDEDSESSDGGSVPHRRSQRLRRRRTTPDNQP